MRWPTYAAAAGFIGGSIGAVVALAVVRWDSEYLGFFGTILSAAATIGAGYLALRGSREAILADSIRNRRRSARAIKVCLDYATGVFAMLAAAKAVIADDRIGSSERRQSLRRTLSLSFVGTVFSDVEKVEGDLTHSVFVRVRRLYHMMTNIETLVAVDHYVVGHTDEDVSAAIDLAFGDASAAISGLEQLRQLFEEER